MPCSPANLLAYGGQLSVLSTDRPTGVDRYPGRRIFETDTLRELLFDGTGWIIMSEPAQTWTPSIPNVTGTGTGYFVRSNGWIDISGLIVVTSVTGTFGAMTLPVAALGARFGQITFGYVDVAVASFVGPGDSGTTSVVPYVVNATTTYGNAAQPTASVPFSWGASDRVEIQGSYRMTTRYS